jgi:hypothetical protein
MTTKDKMGLLALVGMFVMLGIVLYFTVPRQGNRSGSFSNNVFVDQRMDNLKKSK